ncbi:MAG: phage baseplate assembly protein V, partial [bacterium]
ADDESQWARVLTPMAGKDRGIYFLPEVDDEVLVAFDHGDIDYPYVLGALWNSEDSPPETNSDGNNNIRMIRSRSGHEIIFNDDGTAHQEKIEIHTNAGHIILMNDSSGQEKIEIIDKTGNNKMTIDSVRNLINIESTMQLKIKSGMIEIEATGMMTIKAGATLTIEGAMVNIN